MIKVKSEKILAIIIAIALIVGTIATFTTTAKAAGNVSFQADGITYNVLNEDAKIVEVGDNSEATIKDIVIPAKVVNDDVAEPVTYEVVGIGDEAFCKNHNTQNGNESIESITISEGIKYIGKFAFGGAKNLKKIDLPSTIETMKEGAFTNCLSLASVDLSKLTKLETLGTAGLTSAYGVFDTCKELEKVTLPDNLKNIGINAFYSCLKLKDVKFPYNIEKIYPYAFANCKELKTVDLKSSYKLTAIMEGVFQPYMEFKKVDGANGKITVEYHKVEKMILPNVPELSIGADILKRAFEFDEKIVNVVNSIDTVFYGVENEMPVHLNDILLAYPDTKYVGMAEVTFEGVDDGAVITSDTLKISAKGMTTQKKKEEKPAVKATKSDEFITENYFKTNVYLDNVKVGETDINGEYILDLKTVADGAHLLKVSNDGDLGKELKFTLDLRPDSDNSNNSDNSGDSGNGEIDTDNSNTDKDIIPSEKGKDTVAKVDNKVSAAKVDNMVSADKETVETRDHFDLFILRGLLIATGIILLGMFLLKKADKKDK